MLYYLTDSFVVGRPDDGVKLQTKLSVKESLMHSLVRSFVFVLLALLMATSVFAQKGGFAVANDAQLDKYPIFEAEKPLTVTQIADMHLQPLRLEKPTVVQNHFRRLQGKEGRFVIETLSIGTIVLIDENGNIRYKADCGNRLIEFNNQAIVRGIVSSIKIDTSKPIVPYFPAASTPPQKSHWSKFTDGIKNLVNWLSPAAYTLGWILMFFLVLAMLAALYEWARHGRGANQNYPPLPVAPQTAAPGTAQPQHVAQPVTAVPAPAPTATESEPATFGANATRSRLQYHPQNGNNPAMIRTNGGIMVHSVEHSGDEHVIRYRLS